MNDIDYDLPLYDQLGRVWYALQVYGKPYVDSKGHIRLVQPGVDENQRIYDVTRRCFIHAPTALYAGELTNAPRPPWEYEYVFAHGTDRVRVRAGRRHGAPFAEIITS